MEIEMTDIEETLQNYLERKPTAEELKRFIGYLEVDVPQWLIDNAKSFVRDVLPDE